jgi:hypothetical protein
MPMKRSRLSCLFLSAVTAATLVCLLGLAAVAAWYLPLEAERVFGPPAPGLPFTQRLLLSCQQTPMEKSEFLLWNSMKPPAPSSPAWKARA